MNLIECLKTAITREYKKEVINNEVYIYDDLDKKLESADSQLIYVGTKEFVDAYYRHNSEFHWFISGIFQIGFPFDEQYFKTQQLKLSNLDINKHISECWYIFVFSNKVPAKIKLGFNHIIQGKRIGFFSTEDSKKGNADFLNSSWDFSFLSCIEDSINHEKVIDMTNEDIKNIKYSFSEIAWEKFEYETYFNTPWIYKKNFLNEFNGSLSKKNFKKLKHVVQFLDPNEKGCFEVFPNDIIIHKFIYVPTIHEDFIDSDIEISDKHQEVQCEFVLRSFDLSPYYLWAMLKSEYINDYCIQNSDNIHSYHKNAVENIDLHDVEIFISDDINICFYKKKYELEKLNRIEAFHKIEQADKTLFYDNSAKNIISKDLQEIRYCFQVKAYKAAIILAGSVLEAFLIDWLSEIHQKNYFEDDFIIVDKYRNIERRADLKDYIDAIENLKKPSWFDAAKKATEIRRKRNLVHAKLYIDNNDISKETCTDIIDYLEYVINTRWNIKN